MKIERRAMLAGAVAAPLIGVRAKAQSAPPPSVNPAPPSPAVERLTAAVRQGRLPLTRSGRDFSGAGWDLLVGEARAAQFTLLGEEHGVAEIPVLSAALFRAVQPVGYDRLAIEISPPLATAIDAEVRRGGVAGLKRFYADPSNQTAFYTLEPEAAFLAEVRAAVRGPAPALWGLDYEVGADRRLIADLRRAAPAAARPAVGRLEAASRASWAEYETTRNPGKIFSFGGDPELVAAVRAAWPKPDAPSRLLLDTLEETLRINRDQVAGRYWQANHRRAEFNRANFVRYWSAERAAGRSPKVLFKFGSNHMTRGRNFTNVYDVGSLAAEAAVLNGGRSFHMLVVPGAESTRAQFDPSAFRYKSLPASDTPAEFGLGGLARSAGEGSVVIDLRPLRPLVSGVERAAPALARTIHAFDVAVILDRATASASLI